MASKTERTVVNAAGLVQGIVLVTFPSASTIFTSKSEYGLSNSQYGAMFLPQVALAIAASLALAAFRAMVTVGRVLFAAIGRWLPARVTYHILPFVLVGTFLGVGALTKPHAAAGIAVFALAGLGCSALLPLTISSGEEDLTAISAVMAGGVVAFYQLGYGIAAFGVGPAQGAGVSLSAIFGFTAVIAGVMALLSFLVTRRRTAPAELVAAGAGLSRPAPPHSR